jgi:hypothetical protein
LFFAVNLKLFLKTNNSKSPFSLSLSLSGLTLALQQQQQQQQQQHPYPYPPTYPYPYPYAVHTKTLILLISAFFTPELHFQPYGKTTEVTKSTVLVTSRMYRKLGIVHSRD